MMNAVGIDRVTDWWNGVERIGIDGARNTYEEGY